MTWSPAETGGVGVGGAVWKDVLRRPCKPTAVHTNVDGIVPTLELEHTRDELLF